MTGVCRAIHVLLLLGIITSVQITASHETKLVGEKTDACAGPSSSPLSVFIALKTVSCCGVRKCFMIVTEKLMICNVY